MLVQSYRLQVTTPPCSLSGESLAAYLGLDQDIAAVLPYLNAVWPDAHYVAAAPALTCTWRGHGLALHPRRIALGDVADSAEALRLVEALLAEINAVWERRAQIAPDAAARARPAPLALYRLLPRTNCRACGRATCLAFAVHLAAADATPSDCPPLGDAERAALESLLRGGADRPAGTARV